MKIILLESCKRELSKFPQEVREDFFDVLSRLQIGLRLSMPLSRKLRGFSETVFEIRLKDQSSIYRVMYIYMNVGEIYFVYAFKKKSQKTPRRNLELVRKRIRRLI